ncbi:hypothetical protein PAXRUDRAFT_18333 [Paxillus rubicundulus Ve08.2h10]|uniref:Uncharacterized protein n=1 Tax=Paxillus rubicundulus Ve08.2h10 TaxID=930991 RepID=A0A0D0BYM5_9AGAM|nr:hypothetical protein PAXRUDRAFT_18333 [Paxillus rubicundulus Ve08.2h10]
MASVSTNELCDHPIPLQCLLPEVRERRTRYLVDKALEAHRQQSVDGGVPRGQSPSWKRHRTVESARCRLRENEAFALNTEQLVNVEGEGNTRVESRGASEAEADSSSGGSGGNGEDPKEVKALKVWMSAHLARVGSTTTVFAFGMVLQTLFMSACRINRTSRRP